MKFSKKGDGGETSLLGGRRVPKYDLRPECYGTLDEASSVLGVAKSLAKAEKIKTLITDIQKDLLLLGAELAVHPDDEERFDYRITAKHIQKLERTIEGLQEEVPLKNEFILPGANQLSAQIDLARTVVRRAERRIAQLKEVNGLNNPCVQQYANRLADALFTLARYAEEKQ
ncbi:MAG: cob(I)yrinic acid a,c-diamide adenosyltransferase [Deltaproteobacteria bacterium]|nr:cob(I)yrinic acid a,c-diamide adenosyltransferase [Deltaproteobacteria bacterium]